MKIIKYNNLYLHVPDRYYHNNLTDRFEQGIYEKEEIYLCKKYIKQDDNVLELGSCLGFIAAYLSKISNSVISIEANPELKDSLELTKIKNNLDNVEFIHGYLDIVNKEVEFQTYSNIVAGSGDREDLHINNVRGWGDSLKIYKVNTILLEDIKNYEKINALVIDIEGGELIFLKNYKNFIKNNINKLCIELHGHLMKDKFFNRQCISIILEMGFKIIEQIGISYYFEK